MANVHLRRPFFSASRVEAAAVIVFSIASYYRASTKILIAVSDLFVLNSVFSEI